MLNVTYAYMVRNAEPADIDKFDSKLKGTYVPQPGEKPPQRAGPLKISANDVAALDSLKQSQKDPNI